MSLKCLFGHVWDGCKCSRCTKVRDEGHDWAKDCEKCSRCGQKGEHVWDGCRCSRCTKVRDEGHDWAKDCEKCSRCGQKGEHVGDGCRCSVCGKACHALLGSKCSKCGIFLLPKVVIRGHSPARDPRWYIQYCGSVADFFAPDLPPDWDPKENCRIFEERPMPSMSTSGIIQTVKEEWPYLVPIFDTLDVQVVQENNITASLVCFVKISRPKPAANEDARYPVGYFPRVFTLDFLRPPDQFSKFLEKGGYRYSEPYPRSYDVNFSSHDQIDTFLSELQTITQEIPLRLEKCPHGLYKSAYDCERTCKV